MNVRSILGIQTPTCTHGRYNNSTANSLLYNTCRNTSLFFLNECKTCWVCLLKQGNVSVYKERKIKLSTIKRKHILFSAQLVFFLEDFYLGLHVFLKNNRDIYRTKILQLLIDLTYGPCLTNVIYHKKQIVPRFLTGGQTYYTGVWG